jgi:rod shape-determining protein MreC
MRDTRRGRIVLAMLLVGGFALVTLDSPADRTGSAGLERVRRFGQYVFGPVEQVADRGLRDIGGLFAGWGHSEADQRRIAQLNAQVKSLNGQLARIKDARVRVAQLDKLLRLTSASALTTVPARLVALAPGQDGTWSATLDSGSGDGIGVGESVINGDGLVGHTTNVGPYSATVVLAVDPNSTVGVRLADSGAIGIATGADAHTLRVEFLDPRLQVKRGERLVTLGSPGGVPYIPGVPVGTVRSVVSTPGALTRTVMVTPYANVTSLDTLAVVVQPPRSDPRPAMPPGAT